MATRTVSRLETARPTARTLRELFAEELRAELARRQVRGTDLEAMINARLRGDEKEVSQKWVSRRLRGEVALSTDDIERIARALDVAYSVLLPRLDSNQKPAVLRRLRAAHDLVVTAA